VGVKYLDSWDISNKIWSLSNILRDDGIVFHKYMSELTYLLFLKIAEQTNREKELPPECRWRVFRNHRPEGIVGLYRKMLTTLGEDAPNDTVREIFGFPTTVFTHDENLHKVIAGIDSIDWKAISGHAFGVIYESLLERNATEARSGAGQYFTPRPLVDCIVRVVTPKGGETIQDPAAGTGGFLVSANEYISKHRPQLSRRAAQFEGVEIERDTRRLCLMNLFLHKMNGNIIHGDALTEDIAPLSSPDLVLANPPFGTAAGGARPKRSDLPFQTPNKQLMFLQHIYRSLGHGGRAAVIVPDNVLFEAGVGRRIRQDLMKLCKLHTILRLPQGIFYAQGVNTNVLFFERGSPTEDVWYYDLRTNVRRFNKRNPLSHDTFAEFEEVCGSESSPRTRQIAQRTVERLKVYSRKDIAQREDNLDITWIPGGRSTIADHEDLDQVLGRISRGLQSALKRIEDVEREILE
jgi:type I restriction enzyme M protein